MKDRLLKQTKREYGPGQRLAALLIEGIFFMVVLPYVLAALAELLDPGLHLPRFVHNPITPAVGWLLIAAGWLFAMWSIYAQFALGRGTPVPLMATQKLVVQPPYTYCRNPMALGAIVLYLGVSVLLGSVSAALLVVLGAAWLLAYIKRIEEKELEARFGQEYVEYRRRTPFLLPRFRRPG
jgi:protein-S-isoprenylcysteine O-methyltransferase Ste14